MVTVAAPRDFAEDYPRNEEGLILFPRDSDYRKELFPLLKLDDHPAKANIYLVQAIIEYVSQPGDTILDIMAGTGSIMVAALVGRRVVCVDIEDDYVKILEQGAQSLEAIVPGISEMITIIPGDCSKILPIYGIDHIVFSPPYTNILKKSTKMLDKLSRETLGDGLMKYSKHPNNIGNLNEFLYHQVMEKIYKRTLESLNPGGTLTIIIKDHIEAGKRVFLGNRAERDCVRAGYEAMGHYKWLPPGTVYTNIMRARGDLVVDDESVIILKKPGRIG